MAAKRNRISAHLDKVEASRRKYQAPCTGLCLRLRNQLEAAVKKCAGDKGCIDRVKSQFNKAMENGN
jgi:hypothetical protein